ncbi:hypothetical protein HQ584_06975 [Patescibacteria group bacterium]|nr:hypothetical protein [Patescibacteria group bacterium]
MSYRKGSILAIIAETTGKDQLEFVLAVLKNKMMVEFLLYVTEKIEELAKKVGRDDIRYLSTDSEEEARVFINSLRDILDDSVMVDANYLHEEVDCGGERRTKYRYRLFIHVIVHKLTSRMSILATLDSSFANLSDEDMLRYLRDEFDERVKELDMG